MKKYTDLFVDFDDTLYDTHGNAVIALAQLFEQMGWHRYFNDPDVFYDTYWKVNYDLWARYSRGEITRQYLIIERFRQPLSLGRGLNVTTDYCLQVSDRFLDLCSDKPGVVDGAHQLMHYLREKNYRIHMCSNGFHEVQYRKLQSCGLTDFFDTVILSEHAGYNKPAPQFFEYALKQTHAQQETTIMIGDNFNTDILGAKHVGLDTLYFNRMPEVKAPESVTYEVTSLRQVMDIL